MSNGKAGSRVYFARCISWRGEDLGAIKIGLAISPEFRFKAVCAQQPYECELVTSIPGDLFMEAFVHMWLRDYSLGGEFFRAEGETLRILDHATKHRKLPLPVYGRMPGAVMFSDLDIKAFMDRHGITFGDVEELAGCRESHYRKIFESGGVLNRRFLAGLAVTAVRLGLSVHWPLDFVPGRASKEAERLAS